MWIFEPPFFVSENPSLSVVEDFSAIGITFDTPVETSLLNTRIWYLSKGTLIYLGVKREGELPLISFSAGFAVPLRIKKFGASVSATASYYKILGWRGIEGTGAVALFYKKGGLFLSAFANGVVKSWGSSETVYAFENAGVDLTVKKPLKIKTRISVKEIAFSVTPVSFLNIGARYSDILFLAVELFKTFGRMRVWISFEGSEAICFLRGYISYIL